jgi:Glycosyl hydrolase family 45
VQCVPPQGGTAGFTTRFWDCCKPSCAWPGNVQSGSPVTSCNQQNQSLGSSFSVDSSCNGGGAFACYDLSPTVVSDTLAYGYAAFNSGACGQCYQLQFTGQSNSVPNDPGSAALCGKTMIVQVVNIGSIGSNQFDIMIPGGGLGLNTTACPTQWGVSASALGDTNGGFLLSCERQSSDNATQKACTMSSCAQVFTGSDKATLLAGCNWQAGWFEAANNP